jgi:UDP-N-acetylmuramoyl-tripeptide--D-alanyl-D-alanine ligase
MKLSPDELQHISHIEFRNVEKLRGKEVVGVSTDSRTVKEGEVFFALRGANFNGHKFLAEAFAKDAVAAVVEDSADISAVATMPLLVVNDSTVALGEFARYYRRKFSIPVIAVGGSNGKTTTKDMIARVLATKYRVLSTDGNRNNHIGVPQTLFRLEKKHQIAVVEIGTNHPGEIRTLCDILEPTHGVMTNVGREHLEFFRGLAAIAKEEGALFDKLHKQKGAVAFVNADDRHVVAKAKKLKTKVTFSFKSKKVSVIGKVLAANAAGCAKFSFSAKSAKRATTVQLAIPGEHNVWNALCAATVGLTFQIAPRSIKSALENFQPASKRMELVDIAGVMVYNDTYNANPDSMSAALRTLASANVPGKRIAVLADMKELGAASLDEHVRIARDLSKLTIDYLLTFGDEARSLHDASSIKNKIHYEHKNMLAEYLAELVAPGDAVLVKGSRGMRMEDVVAFLQERLTAAHAHG